MNILKAPKITMDLNAWNLMWELIRQCSIEISWLGEVDRMENGDFHISRIFVPKQKSGTTSTVIDAEGALNLSSTVDICKLKFWGHSHVNMGVSPSGTDEKQLKDFYDGSSYFIRGIFNKAKQQNITMYMNHFVVGGIEINPIVARNKEIVDQARALIDENVKKESITWDAPWNHTHTHRYDYGYSNQARLANSKANDMDFFERHKEDSQKPEADDDMDFFERYKDNPQKPEADGTMDFFETYNDKFIAKTMKKGKRII